MKKLLIALLSLTLIFAFCSCGIFAKDEPDTNKSENDSAGTNPTVEEKLKFEKTPVGRYYTVTGIGTYSGTDVVIPKLYNDRAVKSVSADAFAGNTRIKTLTVEDGVEKIGANAFSGCTSLESIRISKTLEKIESSAFENCSSVKTLIFGKGTQEIGKNAFLNCSAIENFYYEGTVSDFRNITGFTWYALEYKNQYFYTKDYPSAAGYFWYWSDGGVPLVWEDYIGNEGLKFEISDDGTYYKVTGNSNSTDKIVLLPKAHKGLPVGEIDAMAFVSASLEEIILPETLTKISGAAFRWCSKLERINLPSALLSIGESAFSGCEALKSITLPENLEKIGDSAFIGCTALTSIVIPDNVKTVGSEAFYGCIALKDVSFGNSVSQIGERAFYLCTELLQIEIPKLVTVLKNSVFADCMSLKQVILHSGVTDVEKKALPASAKVYYKSDSTAFGSINIGEDNLWLGNVYFYSDTTPETEGKFWCFGEDGEIIVW